MRVIVVGLGEDGSQIHREMGFNVSTIPSLAKRDFRFLPQEDTSKLKSKGSLMLPENSDRGRIQEVPLSSDLLVNPKEILSDLMGFIQKLSSSSLHSAFVTQHCT